MKRIIVCSRHSILVAGFRALIAAPAGLEVVEHADVSELAGLPGRTSAPLTQTMSRVGKRSTDAVTTGSKWVREPLRRRPSDLVLIDGDSVTSQNDLIEIKALAPDFGLILWVNWISPEFVREAIHFGIGGILRKNASIELYIQCLDRVASGQLWLENEMSEKLLCTKAVRLSPRERQLVTLLTEGLRNKEIAGRMNITEGTAKTYLSRLFEKTGVSDRFELALYALKNLETDPSAGPSRGPRILPPLHNLFPRRA